MLAVLRILTVFVYFLLANLCVAIICILRPFHRDNLYLAGQLYAVMGKLVGLKIEVRVPESLKAGGPYVYICNHQNNYDVFTACKAAQPGMVTVGKKSLLWIPIFGQIYWLSGNIMIDRKNKAKAQKTLESAVDIMLKRSLSVWFFPEGTRSYGRGLLPFKTGAFRIAEQAKAPVVVVAASNLINKVKLNRWDNGTVLIELSEPTMMDDSKDIKGWSEHFYQQMQATIARLDREIELSEHNKS